MTTSVSPGQGNSKSATAGDYSFFISADDGSRLILKNEYMIERWQRQDAGDTSMTLFLKAGERVPLRMDYFNARGPARARLSWSGPGFAKSVIPTDRLFPATNFPSHPATLKVLTNGLLATFYAKADLTGNTFSRVDSTLDLETKEDTIPGRASRRPTPAFGGPAASKQISLSPIPFISPSMKELA